MNNRKRKIVTENKLTGYYGIIENPGRRAVRVRRKGALHDHVVRKEIEKSYGPVFSGYLAFVKTLRSRAMKEIADKAAREKFLKGLASGDILDALRTKGLDGVKQSVMSRFRKLTGKKQ